MRYTHVSLVSERSFHGLPSVGCVVAKAKQFKIKMQWWLRGDRHTEIEIYKIVAPRRPRVSSHLPLSHRCITCRVQLVAYNAMQF